MSRDTSKKYPAHTDHKRPLNYADNTDLSSVDRELVINFELSEKEFRCYKRLEPYKKAEIIHLLAERRRLNNFVKNHLNEEINKQFGPLMQLFFPSEHSLKYALQKVDEIEEDINKHLGEGLHIFDPATTKRNRLEILLNTAYSYQEVLKNKIAKTGRSALKGSALVQAEEKLEAVAGIINELHLQLNRSEYFMHSNDIMQTKDSELNSFISKIKAIGIADFTPKANKTHTTIFSISFFTAIYEKISPNNSHTSQDTSEESEEEAETKHNTTKPRR